MRFSLHVVGQHLSGGVCRYLWYISKCVPNWLWRKKKEAATSSLTSSQPSACLGCQAGPVKCLTLPTIPVPRKSWLHNPSAGCVGAPVFEIINCCEQGTTSLPTKDLYVGTGTLRLVGSVLSLWTIYFKNWFQILIHTSCCCLWSIPCTALSCAHNCASSHTIPVVGLSQAAPSSVICRYPIAMSAAFSLNATLKDPEYYVNINKSSETSRVLRVWHNY